MPYETPASLSAGIHETIVEGIAVCWGKTKIAVLNAIALCQLRKSCLRPMQPSTA